MKKGDRVEFKTPSGKIIKGIYEGKTEQRAIIKGGKKTYKPPLKLVKKSKAETPKPKKETPKPKEAKKKETDKDLSLRAYKEIGNNRRKINEEAKKEDRPEAFMRYVRYKSGKKKGQIRSAFQSPEESQQERDWYENQVKQMAKKYKLPYVDKYNNWDNTFRDKYGSDEPNELSRWV
tara:strand:- start:4415 stop:4945 length:531 start_codon:yes stop_codon:yes gene_type:complete